MPPTLMATMVTQRIFPQTLPWWGFSWTLSLRVKVARSRSRLGTSRPSSMTTITITPRLRTLPTTSCSHQTMGNRKTRVEVILVSPAVHLSFRTLGLQLEPQSQRNCLDRFISTWGSQRPLMQVESPQMGVSPSQQVATQLPKSWSQVTIQQAPLWTRRRTATPLSCIWTKPLSWVWATFDLRAMSNHSSESSAWSTLRNSDPTSLLLISERLTWL